MEGRYDKGDLRGTEERADKCADTEQGDDEAFADDGECAGGRDLRVGAGGETEEEVLHENDVRDLTGIILAMFQNVGPMSVLARKVHTREAERTYTKDEPTHRGQHGQHDGHPANGKTFPVRDTYQTLYSQFRGSSDSHVEQRHGIHVEGYCRGWVWRPLK